MIKKLDQIINAIKKFIWWRILPLRALLWFRDRTFNSLSKFDKTIRAIFLPYQSRPGYDFYKFEMTEELANYIKKLRCNEPFGHTWRAITVRAFDDFPDLREHVLRDNQMDGQDLCDYAMKFLNEQFEDGWN